MVLGLPDRAGVDQPSRRKEEHAEAQRWERTRHTGGQVEPGCFGHKVCEQKDDK